MLRGEIARNWHLGLQNRQENTDALTPWRPEMRDRPRQSKPQRPRLATLNGSIFEEHRSVWEASGEPRPFWRHDFMKAWRVSRTPWDRTRWDALGTAGRPAPTYGPGCYGAGVSISPDPYRDTARHGMARHGMAWHGDSLRRVVGASQQSRMRESSAHNWSVLLNIGTT
jgi:hypothetical protein